MNELAKFIKAYQDKTFKQRLKERNIEEKKIKHFDNFCEVKASSINTNDRTVEVIASKEVVDRQGDIIKIAGIDVNAFVKNPVVPWAHNYGELPVARAIGFKAENDELIMKLQFPTKEVYPFADRVFKMFTAGYLHAVSIGFIPIKEAFDSELNANVIEKSELLEVSVVPVPANQEALAKALTDISSFVKESAVTINEQKVKSPACRLENETIKECVSRKIPELMTEEDMAQDQAVATANSICKTKCSDKEKTIEENKEVLKEYRKYQVLLRDVLGIEATEDEMETIHEVMKTILGVLQLTKTAMDKHFKESKENLLNSSNKPKQGVTRTVKAKKSLVGRALKVAKKL